ncbi:hypothetical protein [Trueperella sp. LYQ141]|uniref:hypothetical protein n=1 Tax=Trueperella sp. LYQ141 TaxID=3391058 RepID=UPI003983B406
MNRPRRPAQLTPEQIELIEGEADTAAISELAHTSAQAIVRIGSLRQEPDEVITRIVDLIQSEGIDVLAESWVHSPEDSLPGILWRGYLLHEWLRRFPLEARERLAAARCAMREDSGQQQDLVAEPNEVYQAWAEVFQGNYTGDFAQVLHISARFTDFIGCVQPVWINDDGHPLATEVTRRDTAMLRTSQEFWQAEQLLDSGQLN